MKYNFDIFDAFLILFVYLKLTEQISWPWGFVLSPLWVGLFFIVLYALINEEEEE